MANKPPPSRFGRMARLGGLTSRVSGSYLGQRIKGVFQDADTRRDALHKLHLENAERVVDTMGALKGAAMKVGQSLALATDGLNLPPEVSRILGKLNDKAEPVPFDLIRASIEAELDASLSSLFADFDEEPLGTASLAQAHAARLQDGRRVVVKVLHHGIEDSVDSDLRTLRGILVAGQVLRRPKEELDNAFAEIRERLFEELDYYQEAANLEFFRDRLRVANVRVPATFPKLSTGRVLTMERLNGANLDTFLESATPDARHRAAVAIAHSFHDMFYRLRALHADPHGGNYLFEHDGTVGLIDFGCVKRFDQYWVAEYARMALALVDNRPTDCRTHCRELGILTSDADEAFDVTWKLGEAIAGPLRVPSHLIDDSDQTLELVKREVPALLRRSDVQGPRHILYLHRTLGGIYGMLRKLGLEYPYQQLFRSHAQHAVDVAEGRVEDGAPVAGAPE
jgi:predicted unusual protein kinase regulating ubiquinone biosynthesis (AarF/ABC1/UbiB family)